MDDALGVRFSEAIGEWVEKNSIKGCETDSNYQLNIEDAHNIAGYDLVVFADASVEKNVETFTVTRVEPSPDVTFTMHSVSPAFVIDLCRSITNTPPVVLLIHIKGFEWELNEGLTPGAEANLGAALEKFKGWLAEVAADGPSTAREAVEKAVAGLLIDFPAHSPSPLNEDLSIVFTKTPIPVVISKSPSGG